MVLIQGNSLDETSLVSIGIETVTMNGLRFYFCLEMAPVRYFGFPRYQTKQLHLYLCVFSPDVVGQFCKYSSSLFLCYFLNLFSGILFLSSIFLCLKPQHLAFLWAHLKGSW